MIEIPPPQQPIKVEEPKNKIVAFDDIPVGGGGAKPAEVIEVNYDWGEPPPRIKKRFGKKKKKEVESK